MPFWLHEHRVLRAFRSVSAMHKILGFTALMLCLVGMWALFFYGPLQRQLNQKKKEHRALEQQKKAYDATVVGHAAVYGSYQKLFDQKTSFLSTQSRGQLLSFFHNILQQHNVTCCSLVPCEVFTTPVYTVQTLKLAALGDFHDMQTTLEQLACYQNCISFASIAMVPQEDNYVRLEATFFVKQFKKEFLDHV